jgi:hypothetical protein
LVEAHYYVFTDEDLKTITKVEADVVVSDVETRAEQLFSVKFVTGGETAVP